MMGKSGSLKMFACETISSRKLTQASVLACGAGGFSFVVVVFCFDLGAAFTRLKNAPKGG